VGVVASFILSLNYMNDTPQKLTKELSDFECKIILLQSIQQTKEYKVAMESLFLKNKKRVKNIIEFYKTK
jgi:hypothetical protein